ncbi:MAG: glycosyltransferase [Candidatus Yanofskybacteria bacterium]|nr:glycosyltransferase [Candidatus Yanofskybacteria bacterium]
MTEPLVTIQIVVRNGERYLRHCLAAVRAQTYPHVDVVVLDNVSTDTTCDIVREFGYRLIEHSTNLGMWPGQEWLLPQTSGEYILALSVDVILHPQFIEEAVRACEADHGIAAVQGKFFQYSIADLEAGRTSLSQAIIDTCGFALTRARRVVNIGHGTPDDAAHQEAQDIFGVEGAAPFFRRTALEQCRIPAEQPNAPGMLIDPDYFWYGDDLDLAWRMTLFGHRQRFIPSAIAWHDRSTTKGSAATPVIGQLRRLSVRRAIPVRKRQLDWANVRFTIIKNDYIINILRDAIPIMLRELSVQGYMLFFEPRVLAAWVRLICLLPRMIRRRRSVLKRAVVSPGVMHRWYL